MGKRNLIEKCAGTRCERPLHRLIPLLDSVKLRLINASPLKGHPFYNIFSNFTKFFIGFCQTSSYNCLSVEKGISSTIYFVLHWIMSNFVSKFLWVSKYIPCLFESRWVPEGFQAFVFLKQVATDPLFEVWRRKAPGKSFKNLILIIIRIFIIITIILIPSIIIIIHPSLKIVWQGICKADI